MENIYSTRLKRNLRPGDEIRPDFSPPAPEPNAVPVPEPDETVVGIDSELQEYLKAKGAVYGLAQTAPHLGEAVGAGLIPRPFLPGYGLGTLGGSAPFLGVGVGALTTKSVPQAPNPLVESTIPHPAVQAAEHTYQLKLQKRRISLVSGGVALSELGVGHLWNDAPDNVAVGIDILQVTLGGARLANTLEQKGFGVHSALGSVELAADIVNALGHFAPGLKEVLPYTKVLSVGFKLVRDWTDVPEYKEPDAAQIALWERDNPEDVYARVDLMIDGSSMTLPTDEGS